eukprot:95442-Chlamydomonas_euryale.AAC.2
MLFLSPGVDTSAELDAQSLDPCIRGLIASWCLIPETAAEVASPVSGASRRARRRHRAVCVHPHCHIPAQPQAP